MMRASLLRGRAGVAALAAALAISGCSKKSASPVAPPPAAPPVVEAVYPPARATSVRYDTEIWVRFEEALDLSTVNTDNVFFKLDTGRYPVDFVWEAADRRLRIVPRDPLLLRRTYTIEISNRVKTVNGLVAGSPYFWQFTTNSLRSMTASSPPDGATWESPFAMLAWDSTEAGAGIVRYNVWAGTDSAMVANRSGLPIATFDRGFWVPRNRWSEGRRTWWNVRATNLETGEVEESPLWRFDVIPAGTAADTVSLAVSDWGSWNEEVRRLYCRGTVYAGQFMNNGFWWNVATLGPGVRLAGMDVTIPLTFEPQNINFYSLWLSPTKAMFNACDITRDLPAPEPLEVAFGVRQGTTLSYRFSSDYFAAHLEAMARYGRVCGYTARASQYSFLTLGGTRAVLHLYRYAPPPAALLRIVPGATTRAMPGAAARGAAPARRGVLPVFTRP